MRIFLRIDHRDALHTAVSVFIDGALTGSLRMRGSELAVFFQALQSGCAQEGHELTLRQRPATEATCDLSAKSNE